MDMLSCQLESPAGVDENSILDKNEKYQVVWDVLNALRSLDERFDATINKLELNKKTRTITGYWSWFGTR